MERNVWHYNRDLREVKLVVAVPMKITQWNPDGVWMSIKGRNPFEMHSGKMGYDFFETEIEAVRFAIRDAQDEVESWKTFNRELEDREAEIEEAEYESELALDEIRARQPNIEQRAAEDQCPT